MTNLAFLSMPPILWAVVALVLGWGTLNLGLRKYMPERKNGCPKCTGHITRIHRTPLQRALTLLLVFPVRHYACNHCEWHGLLHMH